MVDAVAIAAAQNGGATRKPSLGEALFAHATNTSPTMCSVRF